MLEARKRCQEAMGHNELLVLNMLDKMSPRARAQIVKQQEAMAQAASSASLAVRLEGLSQRPSRIKGSTVAARGNC